MFGASGHALPMSGMFSSFPQHSSHNKRNSPDASANAFTASTTGIKTHCDRPPQQEFVVDVSLDLMQYISESFNDMLVPSSATCQHGAVQPHKGQGPSTGLDTCPSLMGSSCSTHSNQVVPDSPTCRQSQQQDAPASSSSSDCSMRGSCEPDAPAGPSSSRSSSSAGMDLERTDSLPQARSSSLAYDDDFVFQCYYGDPNSPANQQQQRVKKLSPFAAFSTFPGFGY